MDFDKETKKEGLTFDSLTNQKQSISEEAQFMNINYHKTNDFIQSYYNKFGKFTKNEEELKREYINWSKSLGLNIYDPISKQITNPNYTKIMHFLNTHPYLTNRDHKTLVLVKSDINQSYLRYLILTYCAYAGIVSVILRRYTDKNTTFRTMILNNKLRIVASSFISFLIFDIVFKKSIKNHTIIKVLEKRKLKTKYFDNFLL